MTNRSTSEVLRPSDSFGVERVFVVRLPVWRVPETSDDPLRPPRPSSSSGAKPSRRPIPPSTSSPMCPNPFPLTHWSRSSKLRWSIERSFLEPKSLLGMDHTSTALERLASPHAPCLHRSRLPAEDPPEVQKNFSDPPPGPPPGRGDSPSPVVSVPMC